MAIKMSTVYKLRICIFQEEASCCILMLQLKFSTIANLERRKLFKFRHFNCLKIVRKEKTKISTGKPSLWSRLKGQKCKTYIVGNL